MTPRPPDEQAEIEAVIQLLPTAWNTRDAQLFASAFTDPHDYIAVGGRLMLGLTREANMQAHTRLWQTLYAEGSTIRFEILSIDRPVPGVALAIVKNHNDFVASGQARSLQSILSLVLLQAEQGWRIRQFNNSLVQG